MSTTRRLLLRRLWHQLLGLVFLVVVALFITTTVAVYNKAFADVAMVQLKTDRIGTQLREGADVKIRGVRVGEVRGVSSSGSGATLRLALDPRKVEVIPAAVSARLVPKTLFGERYVALQPPSGGAAGHIQAGDVIRQDRSVEAVEVEQVLSEVLPLLRSVRPEKLSSTLNAVSTALDGQGERLGETLVRLSDYLGELNPALPDIKADITGLADVSDVYSEAAPEFLEAMSDLTTTTRTLLEKRERLETLYTSVSSASVNLASFLDANENNLIRLTATAQPVLDILEKYAPQYPCMFGQFADMMPAAKAAFGYNGDQMNHVVIKIIASNRGKYLPGVDEPRYLDKRGPRCYPQVPAPGTWPQYPPDGPVRDGSTHPGTQFDDPLPGPVQGLDVPFSSGGGSTPAGVPLVANSGAEQELVALLQSSGTGIAPEDAPGWSSLLLGPFYRGATVEVR
ncbi:ABC-type transport system involved in resistance to organic solvents, periplasmic component [Saccharomonospora marina XMU15]|uniref:ABC-type transport system involved in resistance to organic solvents, periplasmic component n=1 Tax=Saccharomonospora marina XMU15 TaxID=882083 RepID=H5XA20_9PSEU|nr:MCE family protein [Saccharomonospora marina]EHR53680.1 ABC-type transport system involved in resistance to organic solvents, periplasmic component [Saccharomonospora marina XMU15]